MKIIVSKSKVEYSSKYLNYYMYIYHKIQFLERKKCYHEKSEIINSFRISLISLESMKFRLWKPLNIFEISDLFCTISTFTLFELWSSNEFGISLKTETVSAIKVYICQTSKKEESFHKKEHWKSMLWSLEVNPDPMPRPVPVLYRECFTVMNVKGEPFPMLNTSRYFDTYISKSRICNANSITL